MFIRSRSIKCRRGHSTTPPTGGLNLILHLYISTIRLLWDFDDRLFRAAHEPELLAEDDKLDSGVEWKDLDIPHSTASQSQRERRYNIDNKKEMG